VIAIGAALIYQRLCGDSAHSDHDRNHEVSQGPDGQWRAVTHSHDGRAHTHMPPERAMVASPGAACWRSASAAG
jgi:hypothetical protein